jgi:lipopolysaccharide export system protein LptA
MIRRVLPLALLAMLWLPPVIAQEAPTAGQPINVTADSLVIEESKKEATFTGNVVIARPNLTVTANAVVVSYGSGIDDVESFDASGNVRIETPGQVATGDRAVFDPKTQILRLTGNVLVQNSAGTIGGAVLTVDLETNDTVFEAGDGQRVTGVFTPK